MSARWRPVAHRVTLVLAVLLAAGLVPLPEAAADRLEADGGELPWARWGAVAVWSGTHVVIAGGDGEPGDRMNPEAHGATDEILRYDPVAREVEYARARLPTPRMYLAAVSDGANVWFFGGLGCADAACKTLQPLAQVIRYDPRAETATVVATLPTARYGVATLWDGRHAYLLGGRDAEADLAEVLRFDPRSEQIVELDEQLPAPRAFAAGLWVLDHGLLFGGEAAEVPCGRDACPGRDILLVQPDRHAVTALEPRLPFALSRTQAVRIGDSALLFGPGGESPVVNFDTVERRLRAVDGGLVPPVSAEASAVSDGTTAYVLGGRGDSTAILRFEFTVAGRPSAPRMLQAFPGESPGRVAISWQEPAHADGVEGYRVYRTFGKAKPVFVAAMEETAFVDAGLPPGKQVRYVVVAVNPVGEGAGAVVTIAVPGAACPPRGLTALAGPGAGEVTLRWSEPVCDGGLPIERYVLYRSGGRADPVMLDSSKALSYTDTPPPNKAWRYWVSAANGAGEGRLAGPVRGIPGMPPEPPTRLTATTGSGGIRIAWTAAESVLPVTSYRIQRSVQNHAFETVAEVSGATEDFLDGGCPLGRECRYRALAVSGGGVSPPSNHGRALGTSFAPAFQARSDGTVYVYNDADHDGKADAGEGLAVTPRPPPLPVPPT